MRPKSTSTINITIFDIILKRRVADLLITTFNSFTITPTVSSLIFRYTQQYTMVTWVMGGRAAGLGHISTSPITTNSFSCIARGKMAGLFRPRSTSTTMKYYKSPQVSIIATSIYPPIIIIINDITLLFS